MPRRVPILLLKTRSTPHDAYEDYFSTVGHDSVQFAPTFVPVLQHRPDEGNLEMIKDLVRRGELGKKYGGMIFTSQRAVEGVAGVVQEIQDEAGEGGKGDLKSNVHPPNTANIVRTRIFPIYTVGPATGRALTALFSSPQLPSQLRQLNPHVLGADSGNGAALAQYILRHYNALHQELRFDFYEAPHLPFIPLVGDRSGQYGPSRLEKGDERLRKKGLLFCVGEQRRDVIPKTLMGQSAEGKRIEVEEVEVYGTRVVEGFEQDFRDRLSECGDVDVVVVVVVFSPSGCDAMLRCLGYVGADGKVTQEARERWLEPAIEGRRPCVVATIGPTTRDHLVDSFGFEPDLCASTPSPDGIGEGVVAFLKMKGIA